LPPADSYPRCNREPSHLGGILALVTAVWSFRSARKLAEQDAARRELDVLRGLIVEIDDAPSIAERRSATPLPSMYLREVMPLRFHMQRNDGRPVDSYARAVMRYNGRVERLIAFGEGKRAAGVEPGAEKVDKEHAELVAESGRQARVQIKALETTKHRELQASKRPFWKGYLAS
jgi:hypothetical protein